MKTRRISARGVWITQFVFVAGFAAAYAWASPYTRRDLQKELGMQVPIARIEPPRTQPLVIAPLYDDPEVVSDEELLAVLYRVQPRFTGLKLRPNHVEHALRTWSIKARFQDPDVMSGEAMKDYLVDHGKYLASWGDKIEPLLQDREDGVFVRWGKMEGASVHHDHWLASLTEAGVSLHEPVFTPGRRDHTIADVLQRAMRDFRVDEIETEWSALAFGLWMPPVRQWRTSENRAVSFDLLARRLMRGDRTMGVCAGTHRVYSLMVLVRLDDEYQILSRETRDAAWAHLEGVRDAITYSQFPDGHWPSNWPLGAQAVSQPVSEELFKQVIATGHHLEWLAIAPQELHPPRELILKAADWCIQTTKAQSLQDIGQRYTFFSHVGNALALWRGTHPSDFWMAWEAAHPEGYDPGPVSALSVSVGPAADH